MCRAVKLGPVYDLYRAVRQNKSLAHRGLLPQKKLWDISWARSILAAKGLVTHSTAVLLSEVPQIKRHWWINYVLASEAAEWSSIRALYRANRTCRFLQKQLLAEIFCSLLLEGVVLSENSMSLEDMSCIRLAVYGFLLPITFWRAFLSGGNLWWSLYFCSFNRRCISFTNSVSISLTLRIFNIFVTLGYATPWKGGAKSPFYQLLLSLSVLQRTRCLLVSVKAFCKQRVR